jgi:hypothetical protein
MKSDFEILDADEKLHFYECTECGEMVDKRQLDEVLFQRRPCSAPGHSV